MDIRRLRKWLAEPRTALIEAVAADVCAHVTRLESRGTDFYGYAIHPGEHYDIQSLGAVTNSEAQIRVPRTDPEYNFYRYCVDEWMNWDNDVFTTANALLVEANKQFASMHTKDEADFWMDEFETAHSNALLDAVLRGLGVAKSAGVFGNTDRFLAVWLSDCDHDIRVKSVKRLNARAVAKAFVAEFG